MLVIKSLSELQQVKGPIHLAIGVFDGVHLGHQSVIRQAIAGAKTTGGASVVLTFDPHPIKILDPQRAPRLLTSTPHKLRFIEAEGVTATFVQQFDLEFAQTAPQDFIQQLVHHCDRLQQVCVGEGWTFGAKRAGTVQLLSELGKIHHFTLSSVKPVQHQEQPVSSTLIRAAVEKGELETASKLLGRPFSILGTVSEGQQLGRKLGFPTANLAAHNEQFPPNGVYVATAWYRDKEYGAVVNIGVRPTVTSNAHHRTLELHLFDFDRQIYGEDIEVIFLAYLRPEKKFTDLAALQTQIRIDSAKARNVLLQGWSRLKTGHVSV
jgi:riboflavin kinase / FMN adenylyltransferase